jgi:hypothetical protein
MKHICFAVGLITSSACAATSAMAADWALRVDTGGVCSVQSKDSPLTLGRDFVPPKSFSTRKVACEEAKKESQCKDYYKGTVGDCKKEGVTLAVK